MGEGFDLFEVLALILSSMASIQETQIDNNIKYIEVDMWTCGFL